jgi:hypothetical protein
MKELLSNLLILEELGYVRREKKLSTIHIETLERLLDGTTSNEPGKLLKQFDCAILAPILLISFF